MNHRVQGEGVVLREHLDADVDALLEAYADPAIARWNPGPQDVEAVRAMIATRNDWSAGTHASWVVEHEGRLAGSVSLHHVDLDQLNSEVGYWVAPWARRRGVGRAALSAAAGHGFTVLGLIRVHLFHAVDNDLSCRMATSAGFSLEGTLRQSFRYPDGRHHDEHLHARLASD